MGWTWLFLPFGMRGDLMDSTTYTVTMDMPGVDTPKPTEPPTERPKPRVRGYGWRALATTAVCAMGVGCMWLTNGTTGIGWAIIGVYMVWAAD